MDVCLASQQVPGPNVSLKVDLLCVIWGGTVVKHLYYGPMVWGHVPSCADLFPSATSPAQGIALTAVSWGRTHNQVCLNPLRCMWDFGCQCHCDECTGSSTPETTLLGSRNLSRAGAKLLGNFIC